MSDVRDRILLLLKRMQEMRRTDPDLGGSEPMPAEKHGERIRTFAPDVYRTLSPMLAARFEYAGTWDDAFLT